MLVLINLIKTHDLAWSDHGLKTSTLRIMEGFGKEKGNVQFEKNKGIDTVTNYKLLLTYVWY